MFGEIEAVCLESSTSFSTFDDREGAIRIWYTTEGKKIPVLIELDLPVGDVTFELESMEGVKMAEQDRRRKAFEEAIRFETDGREFFLKVAEKTKAILLS